MDSHSYIRYYSLKMGRQIYEKEKIYLVYKILTGFQFNQGNGYREGVGRGIDGNARPLQ